MTASAPASAWALADLRRELTGALGRLSADQRSVVFLRDVLGLSPDEISTLITEQVLY